MIDLSSVPVSRQLTLRTVMHAAMDGAISRAALARVTGLSKQTMSEVFRTLEDDGWLEVTGHARGGVGRNATLYAVRPRRLLVFGADIGGSSVKAALGDMNGTIVAEREEPTDPRGGDHLLAQIAALADHLAEMAGTARERIALGSVGIPGAYDPRTQRLAMVPNIKDLEGLALDARLSELAGFEIRVDNDVNMAAKGEQWRGEGRAVHSFVFIAIGIGIGMGIVNDDRIVRGARGAAGEIATLPIGADPFDARTFKSGALETAVGSAGISALYESLSGRADVSVREIMDLTGAGDAAAIETIDRVGRCLATAILAVCAVADPERVVLGGNVGARPELLARVKHHLPLCMPEPPECAISTLGPRAALIGAIATGRERLRETLFAVPLDGTGRASQRGGAR
ncbi:ROK family protein [Acuticoccus sp. M5D2P5]|uniref:ROK family transcriptional regulator n=1 Tax=Acuticoccus kalidii TaxID=2910977 RepID=UPI001F36E1D0|nr:ROK family protein [Acuticoccus kalidii]MCF3932653.1 ROK family protein [Acuticoccus kalidii]